MCFKNKPSLRECTYYKTNKWKEQDWASNISRQQKLSADCQRPCCVSYDYKNNENDVSANIGFRISKIKHRKVIILSLL